MDYKNGVSSDEKKSGTPFFSIVIPVYNAGGYLKECLSSVVGQEFTDWEVVMVDDGSTDDSVAIAEEFCRADSRIKLFRSKENSGTAYGPRLRAAALARAPYIVTLDADDVVSSDLLTKLHDCIKAANPDLVISEMWSYDGKESRKILPLDHIDVTKTWAGPDLVAHTLNRWAISMAGFAVRREIYLEADRHVTAEDKASIFSDEIHSRWVLSMCGKVVMCDGRYFYRQNRASVTRNNVARFIDSKLIATASLLTMTATTFGVGSPTWLLALENRFFTLVNLLRLINNTRLDGRQKRDSIRKVSSAMKALDAAPLKGRISPRYLALMRLPVPLARVALKFIDSIIRQKNGI
ncbi:MAG: glycosyltransferase [Muribaculaceae bacterium]|nr:glycosyltransferase [Muribaculaceae bacterium]